MAILGVMEKECADSNFSSRATYGKSFNNGERVRKSFNEQTTVRKPLNNQKFKSDWHMINKLISAYLKTCEMLDEPATWTGFMGLMESRRVEV